VKGCFPKDRFSIDLDAKMVTCPAGVTVPIRPATGRHAGAARFAAACRTCPLAAQCTGAKDGRTITIGPHEAGWPAAPDNRQRPASRLHQPGQRPPPASQAPDTGPGRKGQQRPAAVLAAFTGVQRESRSHKTAD
jgi:hypothetical protein